MISTTETECKIIHTVLYMEIFHFAKRRKEKRKAKRSPKYSIFRIHVIILILLQFPMSSFFSESSNVRLNCYLMFSWSRFVTTDSYNLQWLWTLAYLTPAIIFILTTKSFSRLITRSGCFIFTDCCKVPIRLQWCTSPWSQLIGSTYLYLWENLV